MSIGERARTPAMVAPCAQCPWRVANHGRRSAHGWYTRRNLRRLWNQIRSGGGMQSCHMTDTGHPEHVEAGAKGDRPHECMGSLILVERERRLYEPLIDTHGQGALRVYTRERGPAGLKGADGILYWFIARGADAPIGAGLMPKVPQELLDDPAFGNGISPPRRS